MRHRLVVMVVVAAVAAAIAACVPRSLWSTAEPQPVVVGYLAGWKSGPAAARIRQIDAAPLTHLVYAFAAVSEDGRAVPGDPCVDTGVCATAADSARAGAGGNFAQLRQLKARHPHLQVLIAIGGWNQSGRFSDVALTAASRRAFAASVVQEFIRAHPGLFDGVDIDWEYPVSGGRASNVRRPEDRENFTHLMAELRRQLDAEGARTGRRYLLTAATSAGPAASYNLQLVYLAPILDWFHVMTYDYHAGGRTAQFNAPVHAADGDPSPFWTVDATLARYLDAGVPRSKIVIGVPFYGRVYGGVAPVNDGLFQRADSAAPAPWGATLDHRQLTSLRPEENGFTRHWHPQALVPWLYNRGTGVWITYEDVQSVREKGAYARLHALRGVMAWEVMGDDGTLTRALADGVRAGD